MNDKSNLYIFTKLEVFLIFLFMVVISGFSYLVGFKFGKDFGYESAGYTSEDRDTIQRSLQIKSGLEEKVEKASEEARVLNPDAASEGGSPTEGSEDTHRKLQEEFKKLSEAPVPKRVAKRPMEMAKKMTPAETLPSPTKPSMKDQYVGKYTIQVGAFRSREEAEKFAEGFMVRGYSPLIFSAKVRGETWFRVGIGAFDNIEESKKFLNQEKERDLFSHSSKDPIFREIR